MDSTTKKIVRMLSDARTEKRYAAAQVLSELRVRDAQAVEALGRCLSEDNRLLQASALEALAGVRSKKVADYVMPLLDSSNEEIRAQAVALLAAQGTETAAALSRELHGAPLARRRIIVNILVRNHDEQAIDRLLEFLPDGDLGEHILAAMRNEIDHMEKEEAEMLRKKISAMLKQKEWLVDPNRTARALRLLGYIRSGRLVRTILPFATEKKPVPVRLAALAALRRPLGASRTTAEPFQLLLKYAEDPDPTLARAAVDTLRGLPLCTEATSELLQLSEGRHAEARAFALESLGRMGDPKVIRKLLSHLTGDDPAARDASVKALSHLEGAGSALVKEIQSAEDPEQMRLLCRILRNHTSKLKPSARRSIVALAVRALEEDWPTAQPLLRLLAAVDPSGYTEALLARASSHQQAGRHQVAFGLLNRMSEGGLLDDEGRYTAMIAGLSGLTSKRDLGRASRSTDPVLRHVSALVESGYSLSTRMTCDESMSAEDLFYIGFNYTESKDDDEKEFGGDLLYHLASKASDSKLGRSAQNKLRLMGFDE